MCNFANDFYRRVIPDTFVNHINYLVIILRQEHSDSGQLLCVKNVWILLAGVKKMKMCKAPVVDNSSGHTQLFE